MVSGRKKQKKLKKKYFGLVLIFYRVLIELSFCLVICRLRRISDTSQKKHSNAIGNANQVLKAYAKTKIDDPWMNL